MSIQFDLARPEAVLDQIKSGLAIDDVRAVRLRFQGIGYLPPRALAVLATSCDLARAVGKVMRWRAPRPRPPPPYNGPRPWRAG